MNVRVLGCGIFALAFVVGVIWLLVHMGQALHLIG